MWCIFYIKFIAILDQIQGLPRCFKGNPESLPSEEDENTNWLGWLQTIEKSENRRWIPEFSLQLTFPSEFSAIK